MTAGRLPGRPSLSLDGINAFAARNLELLSAIENTLDALDADTGLLRAIASGYEEVHQSLRSVVGAIDPNGTLTFRLEKASDACVRIFQDARKRYGSACNDPRLCEEDGVAEAYESFLLALREMHDAIEALREWIAVHDAVLEPTTGEVYSDATALFKALLPKQ